MMRTVLTREGLPGLDPADEGSRANVVYGQVPGVRAHLVQGGACALLSSAIGASDTGFAVADAARFPGPPFTVQVDAELMRVGGLSGDTFTGVTRGYADTKPAAHRANRTVFEARTSYVYLLASHPVKSIGRVYIDGLQQLGGFIAYTGQYGDEHPDYPGMAALEFSAAEYAARQFNLLPGQAIGRQEGVTFEADPLYFSDPALTDGSESSFARAGGYGPPVQWAAFAPAYGAVLSQTYRVSLSNPAEDDLIATVIVRQGGLAAHAERILVPAGGGKQAAFTLAGGDHDDSLAVTATGAGVDVVRLSKSTTISAPAQADEPAMTRAIVSASGFSAAPVLNPLARHTAFAGYTDGPVGDISYQTHTATLTEATGASEARVRICSESGHCIDATLGAGASEAITLSHDGGAWSAPTRVIALRGSVRVEDISKVIAYTSDAMSDPDRPVASATARVVVGESVTADAEWMVDTSGEYGGAGSLIERPDHVISHLLMNYMGFGDADIDGASFASAGSSYDAAIAGGYRFGFSLPHELSADELLSSLAFQARSTLTHTGGKWALSFLPGSAPSADSTIEPGDLAGRGETFTFDHGPVTGIANTITAYYAEDCAATGARIFGRAMQAADAASQARYGAYHKEFRLWAIRNEDMAESLLQHVLRERATPLMSVSFRVFYEHFGLGLGDTVEIGGGLYAGRRFYIERIDRIDRYRCRITARQWWV